MARGINTENSAASVADVLRPVFFAKLEFDDDAGAASGSGVVRVHNDIGTLTVGGEDWLGLGDFAGISSVNEGSDLAAHEIELTLSGIDASLLDELLVQPYFQRPVTIYLGMINVETGALLGALDEMWRGKMDYPELVLGSTNGIRLRCESALISLDRQHVVRYADAEQRGMFPGDAGLQYLARVASAEIRWPHGRGNLFGVIRTVGGGSTSDDYLADENNEATTNNDDNTSGNESGMGLR